MKKAGIEKPGSCYLFLRTMATPMLENGADVCVFQEMLGHTTLHGTTIYTHVAIKKLKEIHTATHPGASLTAPPTAEDLAGEASEGLQLSLLAAEGAEERET
jgi:integrase/recombinase XerD